MAKLTRISRQFVLGGAISLMSYAVWADNSIPVVDLSQEDVNQVELSVPNAEDQNVYNQSNNDENVPVLPTLDTSSLSLKQRISHLEQQVQNLVQMNLPQQLTDLQQQVQQLNGQLQELLHQQQHVEALPVKPENSSGVANETSPNVIGNTSLSSENNSSSTTQSKLDETVIYENAFGELAKKEYQRAAELFNQYLKNYPQGQFAANARYWLGEIYFQKKNLAQAELEFKTLIRQFPSSSKIADAQLKLAVLHAQQGKTDLAQRELNQIIKSYPGTSVSQLATIQLQQLYTSRH